MPGRLDSPISQGGTNVSGGQRQRLAIARALVQKPGTIASVYEFQEILVDDLGAVETLVAGTDGEWRGHGPPILP